MKEGREHPCIIILVRRTPLFDEMHQFNPEDISCVMSNCDLSRDISKLGESKNAWILWILSMGCRTPPAWTFRRIWLWRTPWRRHESRRYARRPDARPRRPAARGAGADRAGTAARLRNHQVGRGENRRVVQPQSRHRLSA